MKMKYIRQSRSMQRGAALAIGLVLLAVASMVTITSLNTGIMQERMAANQDNHARSFMAAEAGGAILVGWVNTNGWPTASNAPSVDLTRVVSTNDPSITFRLIPRGAWNATPLVVEVEGHARTPDPDGSTVLAQTRLLVELRQELDLRPPRARAAISCFGGPCIIRAGAGGGSDVGFGTVSGFNHPVLMQPQGANRTMPAVPAVFFADAGSTVDIQGASDARGPGRNPPNDEKDNKPFFQGLNRDGTGIIRSSNNDAAHFPSHYANNPDGTPTLEEVIGAPNNPPVTRVLSLGANVRQGIWVIDTEGVPFRGNDVFIGLVVIRNCGTLNLNGTPNIYGAVVVDATKPDPDNPNGPRVPCASPYLPFAGSGTPAVRFSRDGLGLAAGPGGAGPGFEVVRWMEIIQ